MGHEYQFVNLYTGGGTKDIDLVFEPPVDEEG